MYKLNIGDEAYQCRNNSYVFTSRKEIEDAIDEVEIVTILRIYKGKVYYLVRVLSGEENGFEHEQSEDNLYVIKQNLVDKLITDNISFLKRLLKSDEESLVEDKKAIENRINIHKHRFEEYTRLITLMENELIQW